MEVDELRRTIQKKHNEELEQFREWFLGPDGQTNAETLANPGGRNTPVIRKRSLTDRFVDMTIAADVVDAAWFFENPALEGSCVTVSFAGHHRQMGTRMSVPSGECDAWASEIVGEDWAPHRHSRTALWFEAPQPLVPRKAPLSGTQHPSRKSALKGHKLELIDPYHAVMAAVLMVHCLGILTITVIICGLVLSLGVVVITVHTIRSLWTPTRKP